MTLIFDFFLIQAIKNVRSESSRKNKKNLAYSQYFNGWYFINNK